MPMLRSVLLLHGVSKIWTGKYTKQDEGMTSSSFYTRVPQVGFELETNGFQIYAIANLDKTSLFRTLKKLDKFSFSFR